MTYILGKKIQIFSINGISIYQLKNLLHIGHNFVTFPSKAQIFSNMNSNIKTVKEKTNSTGIET